MSNCILEYRDDKKMEMDAIKKIKLDEIRRNEKKLIEKENVIKAAKSVIILKECVLLYNKCLKNICDKDNDEYNNNRRMLEIKMESFNADKFLKHTDFRLSVLKKIYPDYKEAELIQKAQVFQTGDIIPFDKLPYRLTELLSQYHNKRSKTRLIKRSQPYQRTSEDHGTKRQQTDGTGRKTKRSKRTKKRKINQN